MRLLEQKGSDEIPWVTANPPFVKDDGSMVLPVWAEFPRETGCAKTKTKADAAAYTLKVTPSKGKATPDVSLSTAIRTTVSSTWLIEGTIVSLGGERLLQFFRTTTGSLYQALSEDGGLTWSEAAPTKLPNNGSKVAALVLRGGALVLAYNNHGPRANTDGVRSKLTLAISHDAGETWRLLASIETAMTKGYRYHYPSMLQVGCRLLVAYTATFRYDGWRGPKGSPSGIKIASIALEDKVADNMSTNTTRRAKQWNSHKPLQTIA